MSSSGSGSSSGRTDNMDGELPLDGLDWAALRAQFERDGYLVFEGLCVYILCVVRACAYHFYLHTLMQPLPIHSNTNPQLRLLVRRDVRRAAGADGRADRGLRPEGAQVRLLHQ